MNGVPYHKIQSIYLRDPATKYKTFLEGQFSTPELAMLAYAPIWVAEEKVDGTNIRVRWDGERVTFGGRTDNAHIPAHLLNVLQTMFTHAQFLQVFGPVSDEFPLPSVTLYGEGFGEKIQKGGGDYGPPSFILFDVMVNGLFLRREDRNEVARGLGVRAAPLFFAGGSLLRAVSACRYGFPSSLRKTPPEGLVLRLVNELFDRRGNRIITKVKLSDFPR